MLALFASIALVYRPAKYDIPQRDCIRPNPFARCLKHETDIKSILSRYRQLRPLKLHRNKFVELEDNIYKSFSDLQKLPRLKNYRNSRLKHASAIFKPGSWPTQIIFCSKNSLTDKPSIKYESDSRIWQKIIDSLLRGVGDQYLTKSDLMKLESSVGSAPSIGESKDIIWNEIIKKLAQKSENDGKRGKYLFRTTNGRGEDAHITAISSEIWDELFGNVRKLNSNKVLGPFEFGHIYETKWK